MAPVQVLIASPLEAELAARIQAADPRAEVLFEPDLLPPARYPADHRGDPAFRRDADGEARWRALLDRAEVLFGVPGDSADDLAEVVTGLPRLRWVHATSAGAGEQVRRAGLPAEALERVAITTSSGVHAVPLAEFAIFGLLAMAKDLPRLIEDQRARAWPEVRQPFRRAVRADPVPGRPGRDRARGGPAGQGARHAHGRVPAHRGPAARMGRRGPRPPAPGRAGRPGRRHGVSLPLTDQTAGLIDRATIERLPPDCIFVNVGRGGVVDEPALVDALRDRRIAGAVLDVFATEPLPADSPLWALPNVLVTPHAAALSARENERITELFVDNLRRYLDGLPLRNVVKPGVYY